MTRRGTRGADDSSILIHNMVNANRINHVADRPQVALHTSMATPLAATSWSSPALRVARMTSPPHENLAFLAKYGDSLLRVSGSTEEFGKRFPVPLRIETTRIRGF